MKDAKTWLWHLGFVAVGLLFIGGGLSKLDSLWLAIPGIVLGVGLVLMSIWPRQHAS